MIVCSPAQFQQSISGLHHQPWKKPWLFPVILSSDQFDHSTWELKCFISMIDNPISWGVWWGLSYLDPSKSVQLSRSLCVFICQDFLSPISYLDCFRQPSSTAAPSVTTLIWLLPTWIKERNIEHIGITSSKLHIFVIYLKSTHKGKSDFVPSTTSLLNQSRKWRMYWE